MIQAWSKADAWMLLFDISISHEGKTLGMKCS